MLLVYTAIGNTEERVPAATLSLQLFYLILLPLPPRATTAFYLPVSLTLPPPTARAQSSLPSTPEKAFTKTRRL